MLANELADILTYLDLVAYRAGVDLTQAVLDKWNVVSVRVESNIRLDMSDWHYSHPSS